MLNADYLYISPIDLITQCIPMKPFNAHSEIYCVRGFMEKSFDFVCLSCCLSSQLLHKMFHGNRFAKEILRHSTRVLAELLLP